jgi:2'-5' RNA ligase
VRRGATARLFIAAEPPPAVRDELARWTRGALRGREQIRRVEPGQLHLTLCFLGHRPVDELDAIAALTLDCVSGFDAAGAGAGAGELEVGAPVWLPQRRPRVLAVELRDVSGAVSALQEDVVRALASGVGYEPEKRRFRPHVTVARMRAGAVGGRPRELPATPALVFVPEKVTLYRSRLQPAGAIYEAVVSAALYGGS